MHFVCKGREEGGLCEIITWEPEIDDLACIFTGINISGIFSLGQRPSSVEGKRENNTLSDTGPYPSPTASHSINSMAYPSSPLPHLSGTTLEVCAVFTALAFILTLMLWLWSDWLAFLSLGPGGTPATILGFLRVELLSLFALHDPYNPGPTPTRFMGKPGYLVDLPKRKAPRPCTRGIAPHRQVTQKASPEIFERLRAEIEEMGRSEQGLEIGTSCFEKHGTGLFSVVPAKRTCGGEIVHAHPSDGSMHMTLHPADAKEVLAAGWGERHPIARGGFFERFVPGNFVMIYAPRSEEEIEVVLKIVRAGVWFVSGGDGLTDPGDGAERRDSGYVSEVETGEQPACGGK